jgi:hypothetical protein
MNLVASVSTRRHSAVYPEELCKRWKVGLQTAKNTLRCTGQLGLQHAVHPLCRRYRTDLLVLRYPRLKSTFYTDTIVSKYQSIGGSRFAQVFTNGTSVRVYPLSRKMEVGGTLQSFVEEVGVTYEIVYDPASEMVGKDSTFQDTARYFKIRCRQTEPDTPRQNSAERTIRELKAKWRQRMVHEGVPLRLWDYGMVYETELMSCTSVSGERTGIEEVTGNTPDISEWLDFSLYDWVWICQNRVNSMEENPVLARWLGVAHRIGSDMCSWVLIQNGEIIARTTVQHVTHEDLKSESIKAKMKAFDANIEEKLEQWRTAQPITAKPNWVYLEDVFIPEDVPEMSEEAHEPTPDSFDPNIGATIMVPFVGELKQGFVEKRCKDDEGNPEGIASANPTLDSRMYVVDFGDGVKERLSANIIAEGTSRMEEEYQLLEEISGHQKSPTTSMWCFYLHWMNGDSSWVSLQVLKDSHPKELSDYVVAQGLGDEEAFSSWVNRVKEISNRIISAARVTVGSTSKRKRKHFHREKFGICVPRTVQEALQLDVENKNSLWKQAIEKEMANVRIAFESWNEGSLADIKESISI